MRNWTLLDMVRSTVGLLVCLKLCNRDYLIYAQKYSEHINHYIFIWDIDLGNSMLSYLRVWGVELMWNVHKPTSLDFDLINIILGYSKKIRDISSTFLMNIRCLWILRHSFCKRNFLVKELMLLRTSLMKLDRWRNRHWHMNQQNWSWLEQIWSLM